MGRGVQGPVLRLMAEMVWIAHTPPPMGRRLQRQWCQELRAHRQRWAGAAESKGKGVARPGLCDLKQVT